MTFGENVLVIGVGAFGAAMATSHLAFLGFEWWRIGLGALIALDVLGGAVCNMTDTTKRWYHRAGQTTKDHISFIALHVLHIMLVAWVFRGVGFDAAFALAIGGWLLLSSVIVLRAPDLLKGPVATTLYLAALGIVLYVVGPTPGLEWFVPALFVKLLVGHALPLARE